MTSLSTSLDTRALYASIEQKKLYKTLSEAHIFTPPEWAKQTSIPDEHVIPTLARVNIDTLTLTMSQGSVTWAVTQDLEPVPKYRFDRWDGHGRCEGVWRHDLCVFSLEDLATIVTARSALINKAHLLEK